MYMAVTFIKRSSIPVPVRGKLATNPQVTISENGQMTLSTLAVKLIGGKEIKKVAVGFEKDSRRVFIFPQGHKNIAKMDEKELWELKRGTKTNSMSATLSGSATFLNNTGVFGDDKYNFKDSGSQVLPITEKDGYIFYSLPNGVLPRRQITVRKPRKEKVQAITSTPVPAPQAPKAEAVELELESA